MLALEAAATLPERGYTKLAVGQTSDFLLFGRPDISQASSLVCLFFPHFPSQVAGGHPLSFSHSHVLPTFPSSLVRFSDLECVVEHIGIPKTTPLPLLRCHR